ncbi:AAA family ATPase [Streptomyces mirabilis]
MQQHGLPLVGRHDEVGAVADALRTTGGAVRTVLVTGGAGAGKSAVVEEARRTVVQEGVEVLRLDWEAVEGPAGTAALVEAVSGVLARCGGGRLPAYVTAIRRMQSRAVGPGPEVALLSTLGEVLTDVARHVPFALTLDDVQRMPAPTASALGLLLRTFRPMGVPVVMAGRPMSPGHGTGAQLAAAADRVLELRPLSPADAGALVVRRLGRPVDTDLVTEVLGALGPLAGSPGAMLSVLASLEERDGLLELDGQVCLAVPEGGLRLTADAAELGRLGWPDRPPDADTVATAATLARLVERAELGLDDLHRAKSPDGRLEAGPLGPLGSLESGPLGPRGALEAVSRGLDGLVRDRVVAVDRNGRTTFAVPALASALRALPGPDRPGGVAAGGEMDGPGAGGEAGGPEVVGVGWGRAAARVERACDALGVPSPVAACTTEPDRPTGARGHRPAPRRPQSPGTTTPDELRGFVGLCFRYGDHPGVLALGEPLLASIDGLPGDDRAALLCVTRAWVLSALHEHRSPYGEDADPRYRAALERMPSAAALAALGGPYGIGPHTPPMAGRVPGDPDREIGSLVPVPSPAEVRLLAAAVGGGAEFERARRGLPYGVPGEAALDRLRNAAAYGDLVGALRAVLGERFAGVGQSVAERYHAMVGDYLTGDWDSALSGARRIEARGRSDGGAGVGQLARALAAEIQLMRGEYGRARQWLELIPDSVDHPLVARVRLGVWYWSGQVDEAVAKAWRAVRRARESGVCAGVDRVLLRILSITMREQGGGDGQAALRALEYLEELHLEAASPMTHEAVLLGRGLALGDADSALAAHELVRRRGDLPLSVDCGQCLTDVGDDPVLWLAEATRSAQSVGMGPPVRSLLGEAARRRNVSVPRPRTAREGPNEEDLQLIAMVSAGSTNRQIAVRLACSEKTVEQRLTRLFQQTGCRSRVELAAAWLDGGLARQGLVPAAGPRSDGGDGGEGRSY